MILNTQKQLEDYNSVNRAFHGDKDTYLFGGLEANVAPAYNALNNDYERVDWMKFDIDHIHNVIVRMANQGAFVTNQRYLDVINSVFSDEQFQRKDTEAGRDWVVGELVKSGQWPPTTEVVSQILIDAWDQLPDNATFRENNAETDKRNEQIDAMTQGGTAGFTVQVANRRIAYTKDGKLFDPAFGQAQGFSMGISGPWSRGANSRGFADLSNAEINDLFIAWEAANSFRNMDREQLREYVRKSGATDVFGKNVRPPTMAAPDAQDRLYHPVSGEPFNQKSLIKFINQAAYNGRDLITRNGRIVPRLRDLFERTVRGELGYGK